MGALGIGGVPLWNGYTSKTLLHESIVEYRLLLVFVNNPRVIVTRAGCWTSCGTRRGSMSTTIR